MRTQMIDINSLIKKFDFVRLAGTDGEVRARTIILSCLDEMGIDTSLEPFDFTGSDNGRAVIAFKERTFNGYPFGLNESVQFTGELVFVENPEALKAAEGTYADKIILSYGSIPHLQKTLIANQAKGFISVGPPYTKAAAMTISQNEFTKGYVPCLTLDHDNGLEMIAMEGEIATITMTQEVKKRTGYNIIAHMKGTGPDKLLTYLVAHYDSVARSKGANDNAGGVISLLKIAEHFKKNPPQRDLKIIFFSGEEYGMLGSSSYVEHHTEEIKDRARLVINIDGAGDALGLNKYFVIGTAAMLGYIDGISREKGLVFQKNLDIFSSDCMAFAKTGIPSINIEKCLGKGSFYYHTPDDNASNNSEQGLKTPIKSGIILLTRILNSEIFPIDKKIDPDLKKKITEWYSKTTGSYLQS